MTTMLERITQTICMQLYGGYPAYTEEREKSSQWRNAMSLARAIVEEQMGEPTEAAEQLARERMGFSDVPSYHDMLDAILAEHDAKEKVG